MNEGQEDVRDWAAGLPGQVLQHVFEHDPTTALRRPARAVCPSWRAAVNAHVRQAYCDVSDVPLLRSFTGLKSVVIDEVDLLGRLMRQRQQRHWAIPKQQQPQVQQPFIPSDPLAPPAPPDNSTRSSSSRQRGRQRRLVRPPLEQRLVDLGRIGIFAPPVLDLSPLEQLPGLQDITLRCLHLVRRLPLHTEHLGHVTSLTLHQMHTHGQQHVDALPVALLQLGNLRRLALIGLDQRSVAGLLEPMDPDAVELLVTVLQGSDVEGQAAISIEPSNDQQQQQEEQQQQDGAGKPQTGSTLPSFQVMAMMQELKKLSLEREAGAAAASTSSSRRHRGTSSNGGGGSAGGGSTGGFPTGGSSSICSVLPANALPAAGGGGDKAAGGDSNSAAPDGGLAPGTAAAAAGANGAAASSSAAAAADAPPLTSSGSSSGAPPAKPLPCPWLGNLQCLVLRSTVLNTLPAAALASLTALTALDLSNNYLEVLPPGLASLKQLQVLILDNNNYMRRAHQLPWSGLTALTHLSLSSCASLMGKRLALSQLVGLQRLGATDNDQAPVGASLAGCTALKVLDVRGTRIGRSLSAALIHQLPGLQRCLYGPHRGGKWVAAVRQAAVRPGRLEMVRDEGWVGTFEAQTDQDFLGGRDWVDQEASSGSSDEGEQEQEEEEGSGSGSEHEEAGGDSEGSDDTQTDASTESAGTYESEDSASGSEQEQEEAQEEEAEDSGSWEEDEDEM